MKAILKTKKSLLDICFWKANEYLEKTDSTVADIYSQMFSNLAGLFERAISMTGVAAAPESMVGSTTPTMRDTTVNQQMQNKIKD